MRLSRKAVRAALMTLCLMYLSTVYLTLPKLIKKVESFIVPLETYQNRSYLGLPKLVNVEGTSSGIYPHGDSILSMWSSSPLHLISFKVVISNQYIYHICYGIFSSLSFKCLYEFFAVKNLSLNNNAITMNDVGVFSIYNWGYLLRFDSLPNLV